MPDPSAVPGYWDDDGKFWVYGADSPQEAEDLLATGDYGLEVGTVNGEDYASIEPTDKLDEPDYWDDPEAYEDWLFGANAASL